MKAIKLSTLTKELMDELRVFPIDVEDYVEQDINNSSDPVVLLGAYEMKQGTLIRRMDEVLFRVCCRDKEYSEVSDKTWLEIDGYFYQVDEVIEKLTNADYEVENDL
jgi:hypothetical protein